MNRKYFFRTQLKYCQRKQTIHRRLKRLKNTLGYSQTKYRNVQPKAAVTDPSDWSQLEIWIGPWWWGPETPCTAGVGAGMQPWMAAKALWTTLKQLSNVHTYRADSLQYYSPYQGTDVPWGTDNELYSGMWSTGGKWGLIHTEPGNVLCFPSMPSVITSPEALATNGCQLNLPLKLYLSSPKNLSRSHLQGSPYLISGWSLKANSPVWSQDSSGRATTQKEINHVTEQNISSSINWCKYLGLCAKLLHFPY